MVGHVVMMLSETWACADHGLMRLLFVKTKILGTREEINLLTYVIKIMYFINHFDLQNTYFMDLSSSVFYIDA
jgi:hypothetical protein